MSLKTIHRARGTDMSVAVVDGILQIPAIQYAHNGQAVLMTWAVSIIDGVFCDENNRRWIENNKPLVWVEGFGYVDGLCEVCEHASGHPYVMLVPHQIMKLLRADFWEKPLQGRSVDSNDEPFTIMHFADNDDDEEDEPKPVKPKKKKVKTAKKA